MYLHLEFEMFASWNIYEKVLLVHLYDVFVSVLNNEFTNDKFT